MEKMVALVLIAYVISMVSGGPCVLICSPKTYRNYKHYSGLFIFLKLKWILPYQKFRLMPQQALQTFTSITHPVRTRT